MYDLNEITRAMDIIQNPNSNPQDRINAEGLCSQINNASEALDIALELLQNGHYSIHVRYFGLHLIENYSKRILSPSTASISSSATLALGSESSLTHQSSFLLDEKGLDNFKNLLLRLISFLSFNSSERILRAKLSEIIVQCLFRIWPQGWSTFFNDLLSELAKENPMTMEIIFEIFGDFFEDLHSSPSSSSLIFGIGEGSGSGINSSASGLGGGIGISSGGLTTMSILEGDADRLDEIQSAFNALVLPQFSKWYLANFERLLEARKSQSERKNLLRIWNLIIPWIPLNNFQNEIIKLITLLLSLLLDQFSRTENQFNGNQGNGMNFNFSLDSDNHDLADAILAFSTRIYNPDNAQLISCFIEQALNDFERAVMMMINFSISISNSSLHSISNSQLSSCIHLIWEKLSISILNLGITFICHKKNPLIPRNLNQFLNLVLCIQEHIPSLVVQYEIGNFWISFYKSFLSISTISSHSHSHSTLSPSSNPHLTLNDQKNKINNENNFQEKNGNGNGNGNEIDNIRISQKLLEIAFSIQNKEYKIGDYFQFSEEFEDEKEFKDLINGIKMKWNEIAKLISNCHSSLSVDFICSASEYYFGNNSNSNSNSNISISFLMGLMNFIDSVIQGISINSNNNDSIENVIIFKLNNLYRAFLSILINVHYKNDHLMKKWIHPILIVIKSLAIKLIDYLNEEIINFYFDILFGQEFSISNSNPIHNPTCNLNLNSPFNSIILTSHQIQSQSGLIENHQNNHSIENDGIKRKISQIVFKLLERKPESFTFLIPKLTSLYESIRMEEEINIIENGKMQTEINIKGNNISENCIQGILSEILLLLSKGISPFDKRQQSKLVFMVFDRLSLLISNSFIKDFKRGREGKSHDENNNFIANHLLIKENQKDREESKQNREKLLHLVNGILGLMTKLVNLYDGKELMVMMTVTFEQEKVLFNQERERKEEIGREGMGNGEYGKIIKSSSLQSCLETIQNYTLEIVKNIHGCFSNPSLSLWLLSCFSLSTPSLSLSSTPSLSKGPFKKIENENVNNENGNEKESKIHTSIKESRDKDNEHLSIVKWFRSMQQSTYQTLSQLSKIPCFCTIQLLGEIFQNIQYFREDQWILMQKFLLSSLVNNYEGNVIFPLFKPLSINLIGWIKQSWNNVISTENNQSKANENGDKDEKGNDNEMEKKERAREHYLGSLVSVTLSFVEMISDLLSPLLAKRGKNEIYLSLDDIFRIHHQSNNNDQFFLLSNMPYSSSQFLQSQNLDQMNYFPSSPSPPLAALLIGDGEFQFILIEFLFDCLEWNGRNDLFSMGIEMGTRGLFIKIFSIIQNWLSFLMASTINLSNFNSSIHHHHQLLFTKGFTSLLSIITNPKMIDCHNSSLIIMTELFKWNIFLGKNIIQNILVELGNISPNSIIQLMEKFKLNSISPSLDKNVTDECKNSNSNNNSNLKSHNNPNSNFNNKNSGNTSNPNSNKNHRETLGNKQSISLVNQRQLLRELIKPIILNRGAREFGRELNKRLEKINNPANLTIKKIIQKEREREREREKENDSNDKRNEFSLNTLFES